MTVATEHTAEKMATKAAGKAGANGRTIRWGLFIFLAPPMLWLLLLIVLPHLDLFFLSLQARTDEGDSVFGVVNYMRFFSEPIYWITFARTAVYSIMATFLTLLVAFPVAFFLTKVVRVKVKGALFLMMMLSFWVSELVRTYGWMILLRESGVLSEMLLALGLTSGRIEFLYNDTAIMVGLIYNSMLFMVVPIFSVLDTLDDSYIEAGYDLGGNGWIVTWKVVVPYAMPGIVSGSIVVFMLTLGNYLVPNLLGGKNSLWFTEQIYNQFITRLNWGQGSAFGFLLLVLSSLIVWAGLKLTRQELSKVVQ